MGLCLLDSLARFLVRRGPEDDALRTGRGSQMEWHLVGLREPNDADHNQCTYCDLVGGDSIERREVGRTGLRDWAPC